MKGSGLKNRYGGETMRTDDVYFATSRGEMHISKRGKGVSRR